MRSVEVRTVHSENKMAAAPHVDLDGADVEGDSPLEGEDHGDDDRGAIVLKELVRKYRKNKKLPERSSSGQSTAKVLSQSTTSSSVPNTTSSTGATRQKSAKSSTCGTSAALSKPVKSLLWTDDKISKLIELCEVRSCIWDIDSADYHNRDMKSRAFQEIADELGMEKSDCQGKWKNLRSQFGRERNNLRKTKSGQGTDELYKCTWRYFDALSFLSATFIAGKSADTINDVSENDTSGSQETSCDIPCQPSSQKRKRTPKQEEQNLKTEILKRAVNVLSSPADEKQTKTAGERFGSYVAEKLNEFSSRKRALAEKKISDVLFEVEMLEEQRSRPSNFQFSNANANYPNTANDSGAYNTGGAYYQNFLNNFPDSF